ncbi:rCG28776 [Rattus norvegicus]|uniref:RCG28776 n=1 Tax=Rattus norvegicus TaxID=10116 RepID=A6HWF8_RAT|nr:rCG28776 [Rattus norvegicus]
MALSVGHPGSRSPCLRKLPNDCSLGSGVSCSLMRDAIIQTPEPNAVHSDSLRENWAADGLCEPAWMSNCYMSHCKK